MQETVNKITESAILDNRELRDRAVERTEVLDKVKELFLLPKLEVMTMQQVADYYEVDLDTVRQCYNRNKDEINSDGGMKVSVKSVLSRLGQDVTIVNGQYYKDVVLSDGVSLRIPNVGIIIFPKRAVIRFGTLLRDSEIAKEVRTQLLNVFEQATDEQKTAEIDREKSLLAGVVEALAKGDQTDVMGAFFNYVQYQNRHVAELTEKNEKLEEKNDELDTSNKILAKEILTWSDRSSINKAIRIIANMSNQSYAYVWMKLYDELLNKHHINLKARRTKSGKKSASMIAFVRENEWPDVQQSLAALCHQRGINPGNVYKRAKMAEKFGQE